MPCRFYAPREEKTQSSLHTGIRKLCQRLGDCLEVENPADIRQRNRERRTALGDPQSAHDGGGVVTLRSGKRIDVKDRKTCVRTPLSEFRKKCALFQQQPRKIGAIARSGLQKRAKIWHTQNIRRKR